MKLRLIAAQKCAIAGHAGVTDERSLFYAWDSELQLTRRARRPAARLDAAAPPAGLVSEGPIASISFLASAARAASIAQPAICSWSEAGTPVARAEVAGPSARVVAAPCRRLLGPPDERRSKRSRICRTDSPRWVKRKSRRSASSERMRSS